MEEGQRTIGRYIFYYIHEYEKLKNEKQSCIIMQSARFTNLAEIV